MGVEDYSELEKTFAKVANDIIPQIEEKLAAAMKLLGEAEELSEEHGVPFYSNISPLGQSFRPESFAEKFSEVDSDVVYDLTESYGEYDGWQHSAVC